MPSPLVAKIERFFADRYGREAMFLPSGRLALLLAFTTWLRPHDRILMSPVTDDVVFFLVLAAGLEPVIGPLDAATGNLDLAAVPLELWPTLSAVLTTNLYGFPDRMDLLRDRCERHGTVIIEDACHALDSRFAGQRIGTFGTAAAFSLSKHLRVSGGVLTFSDSSQRGALTALAQRLLEPRRLPASLGYLVRPYVVDAVEALRVGAAAMRTRSALGLARSGHGGHRMPYRIEEVQTASVAPDPLTGFRDWLNMDHAAWRMTCPDFYLRTIVDRVDRIDENMARRLAGQRRLSDSDVPLRVTLPEDTGLFRVPLFVHEREQVRSECLSQGLPINYIYDPPLDVYAHTSLADRLASPPAARAWSRDVLPVDPLDADRFLAAMGRPGRSAPVWAHA